MSTFANWHAKPFIGIILPSLQQPFGVDIITAPFLLLFSE